MAACSCMITSADEFVALRSSRNRDEYLRAAGEEAPLEVWMDIIRRFPDMRFWAVVNKTVPVEVLTILVEDPDPRVRSQVARKRRTPPDLLRKLAGDPDSG